MEMLRAQRWPLLELLIAAEFPDDIRKELCELSESCQVRADVVSSSRLTQLCGTDEHQGLLARMAEFPYGTTADWGLFLAQRVVNPRTPPLFVICDHIQDAHNFGAILRCCEGAAATAVVVESRQQAAVTPHVARSSAGAVNYLNLFRVDELADLLQSLKDVGVLIVAATEKASTPLWQAGLGVAVAVVVGSETAGIRPELLEICDRHVSIPMLGQVTSLNAAVAAGVLMYEVRRQHHALMAGVPGP